MSEEAVNNTNDALSMPVLLRRLAVGLGALLGVAFALGMVFRGPLEAASHWFVDSFGLVGVGVGVMLIDASPFLVAEPVMFFGYEGNLGFWSVVLVAGLGSWFSGVIGWSIGRLLGNLTFLQRQFRRYRIQAFMERYGTLAVAVGAITPFPYAITTYAAGATNISIGRVMLGALLRWPKALIYLGIVVGGWEAAGM